jgi:DNA gyrase subunit A
LGIWVGLILSASESDYGKRTDVDQYRLQSRGGKGVINMKTTAKIGKVTAINLVDDTSELMVIGRSARSSGSTPNPYAPRTEHQRVKLLNHPTRRQGALAF